MMSRTSLFNTQILKTLWVLLGILDKELISFMVTRLSSDIFTYSL